MSKLFKQPVCFPNPNAAQTIPDYQASISTLGGLSVLKNVIIGDTLLVHNGINANDKTISNVRNALLPSDAVNLRTLLGSGDNLSIRSSSSGKLQIAPTALTSPLIGGGDSPISINLHTSLVLQEGKLKLNASQILDTLSVARISGLNQPELPTDVVTRAYFDSHITGLRVIKSVLAASKDPISITGTLLGVTVDGITLKANDRILLFGQTDALENGVWIVQNGPPLRSPDMQNGIHTSNMTIYVETGNMFASITFVSINASGLDVIGTHPIAFTQYSGNGSLIAGAGLLQNGASVDVNIDSNSGLQIINDKLSLKDTQPNIKSIGGVSGVDVPGQITLSAAPTITKHVTNKEYVDGLTYLLVGSGITKASNGALSLSPQISLADIDASGHISTPNAPSSPSHVVNSEYLRSLQWLDTDESIVKDEASQLIKVSSSQPGIHEVGKLTNLSIAGHASCDSDPILPNHLVRKSFLNSLNYISTGDGLSVSNGKLQLSSVQSFNDLSVSYNIVCATTPSLSTHVTNKAYVDGVVATRNPSALVLTSAGSTTSGVLTFATTIDVTAPFAGDVTYSRDSSNGDTFLILKAGVYAINATLYLSAASQYSVLESSTGMRLWNATSHVANETGNVSFVGYLRNGYTIRLKSGQLDPTSQMFISRI